MEVVTVLLCGAVFLASAWLLLRVHRDKGDLHKLPGPPGIPLLGCVKEVANPRVHRVLTEWADKYGPMYRLKLLGFDVVVVSDPLVASSVFTGKNAMPKAYKFAYDITLPIVNYRHNMFNTHDDELWRTIRKTTAPAFSSDALKRTAFPLLLKYVDKISDQLVQAGAEQAVNFSDKCLRLTLDLIGDFFFQHHWHATDDNSNPEVYKAVPKTLVELNKRVQNPLRVLLHTLAPWLPSARRSEAEITAMNPINITLAKMLRSRPDPAPEDNSISACLQRLKYPGTDKPFDLLDLASNANMFLVGGFETTGHTISWCLYDIARHPDVADRLAAELDAAGLLVTPTRPHPRQLEHADLGRLPYAARVLKESMRLHTVAGTTGTIREAVTTTTVGGYRLPAKTVIWMPVYTLANTKNNWVHPERFWPDRWANDAATNVPTAALDPANGHAKVVGGSDGPKVANDNAFLPFMDGLKNCIGQRLALMEALATVALLCSRFSFQVAPQMGSEQDVADKELMALTLWCQGGIHLLVTPRAA